MASNRQLERTADIETVEQVARLLPDPRRRDIRERRPALLSLLLKLSTLRRLAAVAAMFVLDGTGLLGAIFTALSLKALILTGTVPLARELRYALHLLPLPLILTVILFSGAGLYGNRSSRPGIARIVASLFQVAVVTWLYAAVSGNHYRSYYIFYGSLIFALIYVAGLRHLYARASGAVLRAAGYRRRAVLVGRGEQIAEVARALQESARTRTTTSPVEVVGYVTLEPMPPLRAVRCLGVVGDLPRVLGAERVDELIIADSHFPEREALELVDLAHQRGLRVFIAPSTMELLINKAEFVPGQLVPLFELGPPI